MALGEISKTLTGASADMFTRAVRQFDKTMAVLVISVWVVALGLCSIALFTVKQAHQARVDAEEAAAAEPTVPIMSSKAVPRPDLDKYIDRLKKRYDQISFGVDGDGSLQVSSANANDFLDWMAALTYLDTVAPQVRWSVKSMCIGSACKGARLMQANVVGEQVSYTAPSRPGRP